MHIVPASAHPICACFNLTHTDKTSGELAINTLALHSPLLHAHTLHLGNCPVTMAPYSSTAMSFCAIWWHSQEMLTPLAQDNASTRAEGP